MTQRMDNVSRGMEENFSTASVMPLSLYVFNKHTPFHTFEKETPPKYAARMNRLAWEACYE